MIRRTFAYATLILLLACLALYWNPQVLSTPLPASGSKAAAEKKQIKIVVIPLDSRPPCGQFLVQLAPLAGCKIILPPKSILDAYQRPADIAALRAWLLGEAPTADAAIISIDMLEHGGLWASRNPRPDSREAFSRAVDLLRQIHAANPRLKIHVFSIIPRQIIADNPAYIGFQPAMLQYSTLWDLAATFENPADITRLNKTAQNLPPELLTFYDALFASSLKTNRALIRLVEENVLASLIIGQDDSGPYGIPNIIKDRLEQEIANKPYLAHKVFITHGADEVALAIMSRIAVRASGARIRIFPYYSEPGAAYRILPFMPVTLGAAVRDKVRLVGAELASNPKDADILLFVHAGTSQTSRLSLENAASRLRSLVEKNKNKYVALVDLTEDFYAHETLLPALLRQGFHPFQLAAYAGWNTAGNSIGTAVAHSALLAALSARPAPDSEAPGILKASLEFLAARYLDDWNYLKEIQPEVDGQLRSLGIQPNNIGYWHEKTSRLIARTIEDRAHSFFTLYLAEDPVSIWTPWKTKEILVKSLSVKAALPWPRTFEAELKTHLNIEVIDQN